MTHQNYTRVEQAPARPAKYVFVKEQLYILGISAVQRYPGNRGVRVQGDKLKETSPEEALQRRMIWHGYVPMAAHSPASFPPFASVCPLTGNQPENAALAKYCRL